MTKLIAFLQGKKTYIIGFAAAIYGAGIGMNLWPHMIWLDVILGGTATVSMRAGIAKTATTTAASVLLCAMMLTGCNKTLEAGGAYSPASFTILTNNGVASTNITLLSQPDLAFFEVDSTFDLAASTIQAAFKFERDNRAALWIVSPKIKQTLDGMRPTAWDVIVRYTKARAAYMANPTPVGLTTLQQLVSKAAALASAAGAAITAHP